MSISWKRIYGLVLRHTYPLKRDFDLLSDMIYWPIIDILIWGITGQWLGGSGGNSVMASLLTALILWNVIWRSQSEISRNLIDELWNNNLVNLFSTPLSLKEWLAGVIALSVVKTIFTMVALSLVVLFLYSVNIFVIGWWLLAFFILAIMTGWWVGFISAGIVIRYGQKVQTVVWTLPGILLPFSVVFFPLANFPSFLQPISYLVPSTYIFESMRSLLAGSGVNLQFIAISLLLNSFYLILSIIWFIRSFKWSLNLGLGRFS